MNIIDTPMELLDPESVYIVENDEKKRINPGGLIRPLYGYEISCAKLAKFKTQNVVMGASVASAIPIPLGTIQEAVSLAVRNHANLQMCLGRRGCTLWLKRVKTLRVNLEVCTQPVNDALYDLMAATYDMKEGPLWKIRIVIPPSDSEIDSHPKIQFTLFLSAHHTISDGKTSAYICSTIVRNINDLMKGKIIVSEPLPVHPTLSTPLTLRQIIFEIIERLRNSRVCYPFFTKKLTFNNAIPYVRNHHNPRTHLHPRKCSIEDTLKLFRQCKLNKVSVNSCITTILNYAILEVAQTRSDVSLGQRPIISGHAVDLRRYFAEASKNTLGCHVSGCILESAHDLREPFWDSAGSVHSKFRKILDDNLPRKNISMNAQVYMIASMSWLKCILGRPPVIACHYASSNMANLNSIFLQPQSDDVAEVVSISKATSLHSSGNGFAVEYHTFNDQLVFSVQRASNVFSKELADLFADAICHLISRIANEKKTN